MKVANIGFLLDRLGQDCHPLQFLRELTQNSIEAIQRTGKPGQITWDVDWNTYELEQFQKLCIIDTGDGMTGEEMVKFINQLSSSVAEQSLTGNYGVGAKVSAATRNRHGVVYLSWNNGQGSMIQLYKDRNTGQYGLRQWERADGTYGHFLHIEDDVKPDGIQNQGTMVILYGNSEDENTMRAPNGVPSPSRWISKYLNTRYYKFPDNIKIRAREGWEYPRSDRDRNYLRSLTGQEAYLQQHAISFGELQLTNATAGWWILKEEPAITNNSGFIESSGHMAALYQNELYELATARAGMSRLQQFGITFGYRWVVIYVKPFVGNGQMIMTNTARTSLLINNEPLPWADWAAEFRDNLPAELEDFVREKAAGSASTDHTKSIRDRLKEILDLFKVTRYRPTPSGSVLIEDEQLLRGGQAGVRSLTQSGGGGGGKSGQRSGTAGNIYAVFEKKDGAPGQRIKPDLFPEVRWVNVRDGTRSYGDIEDRAAKYLADQNLLLINSDFRVFADMVEFFVKEFGDQTGVKDIVEDAIHSWFEQALVETVIGIQALRGSKEWTNQDLEKAHSDEALTAVVMQRYHVNVAVKRELGSKLGSRRPQRAGLANQGA